MGRRLEQTVENYSPEHFRAWNDRSRENLGVDTLDLVQLHCPPTDLYYHPEVFEDLDAMVAEGADRRLRRQRRARRGGAEGDRVPERRHASRSSSTRSASGPAGVFFAQAARRGVGVIVRVPLASGLLSGKYTRETTFGADDHRNYNRSGAAFDVGETFAGVPFEVGLDAVEELRPLVGGGRDAGPVRAALDPDARRGLDRDPGRALPEQARANAAAAALPALDDAAMAAVRDVYDEPHRTVRPPALVSRHEPIR